MPLRFSTPRTGARFCSQKALREENGAELTEAALVLPILLTLLLGIFWMGRAYMVYETITRAAREGARYEVLPSCSSCGNSTVDLPSSSCLDTSSATFQNY